MKLFFFGTQTPNDPSSPSQNMIRCQRPRPTFFGLLVVIVSVISGDLLLTFDEVPKVWKWDVYDSWHGEFDRN